MAVENFNFHELESPELYLEMEASKQDAYLRRFFHSGLLRRFCFS